MRGADELSVGQLRRQLKLGTEAIYRVQDVSTDPVQVEVVSGPGLLAGDTYSLTRAAVLEMEVLPQPGGNSAPAG